MKFNVNVNLSGYIDDFEGSIEELILELQDVFNDAIGSCADITISKLNE